MGFTQEAFAARLGVERSTVARWERGIVTPLPWMQPTIAKALKISVDTLLEFLATNSTEITVVGTAHRQRDLDVKLAPANEIAYQTSIRRYEQSIPSKLPAQTATVVTITNIEEAFAVATQRAYEYKLAYQTRIDTTALADDVRHLAQAYPRQPLAEVLSPLLAAQQAIYEQLEQGTVHTESARDLHFLAGITAGMLAKAAHDSGDPARAVELARSAAMAGELAGHRSLQAWISGLLALVTYWAGQPQESIRHARRAAHLADGTSSSVTVWAAVSEARAWAKLHNAAAVENALTGATDATDRITGDDLDAFGGLLTFSRARALYYAAEAAVTVGLSDEAVRYGVEAVQEYSNPATDHWAFGDSSGASAALATAYVHQGEVEGANAVLAPVFDLLPTQRINGVIKCVEPVYKAVSSTDTGEVGRELTERIEAFTRVAIRAVAR